MSYRNLGQLTPSIDSLPATRTTAIVSGATLSPVTTVTATVQPWTPPAPAGRPAPAAPPPPAPTPDAPTSPLPPASAEAPVEPELVEPEEAPPPMLINGYVPTAAPPLVQEKKFPWLWVGLGVAGLGVVGYLMMRK